MTEIVQGWKTIVLLVLIAGLLAVHQLGWVPTEIAGPIMAILAPMAGVTAKLGQRRVEEKLDAIDAKLEGRSSATSAS